MIEWKDLIYILAVAGFIWAFIRVELYFIRQTREKFLEIRGMFLELKILRDNLYNSMKDKRLQ
jgi:hypothetical protein